MVLCLIFGCGNRTGRDKGIAFARVPQVVTNQGEEAKNLSKLRRKLWISAISRADPRVKTTGFVLHLLSSSYNTFISTSVGAGMFFFAFSFMFKLSSHLEGRLSILFQVQTSIFALI